MKNIAVFASGNGTNCENIIRYFSDSDIAKVVLVVSNKADAMVLKRASKHNVPSVVLSKDAFHNEKALIQLLDEYRVDYIILAGFLLMIPPFLVNRYERRMINIHPSLLPKFGGAGMYGRHVHEAVKAAGEKRTGITIHYVNNDYDKGEIIAQYDVEISPTDTVEDIESKIHVLEMRYFPKVIESILR